MLPYVYDARAAEGNIVAAIEEMAAGRVDAIALTSSGQVRRLVDTAKAKGLEAQLGEALDKTPVASVGPVVSDELKAFGFKSDIVPDNDAFFMRPLISAMATQLTKTQTAGPRRGMKPRFRAWAPALAAEPSRARRASRERLRASY